MSSGTSGAMLALMLERGVQRTTTSVMKANLEAIEECLAAGYQHATIHTWLSSNAGLTCSFATYKRTLARIRSLRSAEVFSKSPGPVTDSHLNHPTNSTSASGPAAAKRWDRASGNHDKNKAAFVEPAHDSAHIIVPSNYDERPRFTYDATKRYDPRNP